MEAQIIVGGADVSEYALLEQTKISYDSSRRITNASITLIAEAPGTAAKYDAAVYNAAIYGIAVEELQVVTIRDRRDGSKLFEGQIYAIDRKQTDAAYGVVYVLTLNDYGAWLDRSICWDNVLSIPMPTSDQDLIRRLVGTFCPQINTDDVAELLPTIMSFEWAGKTLRQVLDDVAGLSAGEWRVDFDGRLWYGVADDAPAAPYGLSTEPDYEATFPVRVDSFKRDFSNPVNHAYIRGAYNAITGILAEADYQDPVSIQKWGEYSYAEVDDQITETYDAELKAKTTVLKNANPVEQGTFVVWTDDLKLGQRVAIRESALGIDGEYIIRSLALAWKDKGLVEYQAQFGAAQPDLVAYLRLIDQRTRWKSTNRTTSGGQTGPPPPGSVSDVSIAPGGLSAGVINSVNAQTLIGQVTAGQISTVNASSLIGQVNSSQIGSVNAGVIVGGITADQITTVNATSLRGSITANQIGSVNASSIQGSITAGQIGSVNASAVTGSLQASQIGGVNATTIQGAITAGQVGSINAAVIQGVVLSSQLADGIVDDLAKYADALRPVQIWKDVVFPPTPWPNPNFPPNSYFYYEPNQHFYRVSPDGNSWADQGTNPDTLTGTMSFYTIGHLAAQSIVGLIVAAQIQSIQATQITGAITAGQISSVNAGAITGTLTAAQIGTVNASSVTGTLSAGQIQSVTAGQITGQIASSQIGGVKASTIEGTITAGQIASVNATAIAGVITGAQISTINATQITGALAAAQIGSINAATITIGVIGDSQIGSLNGQKIIAGTVTSDRLDAYSINVGYGGNKPGRINVYDTSGTYRAQIGALDSGNYGGWFQVFGAGGTGYNDAKVKTDTGGNLSITDASISINSGSYKISTSTQTFDSSYGSLALKNEQAPDSTAMVSRGIVVYYSGAVVASLVRSPGGAWGSLNLMQSNGSGYILLSGQTGSIRADGGYTVGGNVGQTETVSVGGVTLRFVGGIYVGH